MSTASVLSTLQDWKSFWFWNPISIRKLGKEAEYIWYLLVIEHQDIPISFWDSLSAQAKTRIREELYDYNVLVIECQYVVKCVTDTIRC